MDTFLSMARAAASCSVGIAKSLRESCRNSTTTAQGWCPQPISLSRSAQGPWSSLSTPSAPLVVVGVPAIGRGLNRYAGMIRKGEVMCDSSHLLRPGCNRKIDALSDGGQRPSLSGVLAGFHAARNWILPLTSHRKTQRCGVVMDELRDKPIYLLDSGHPWCAFRQRPMECEFLRARVARELVKDTERHFLTGTRRRSKS